jgi:hypothetical protein
MTKCIGTNKQGEKIFSMYKKYAIDASGMILKIDNENDTFEFTRFYSDTPINEKTKHKDIRNSIVNLESVAIDGYSLNLVDFELDSVPYLLLIKGSSDEIELLEKIKKLPSKHQFFARNVEVAVFIHCDGNSAIIKKDHLAKFHKDNSEIGNKKLTAILKSVACQFDEKYEDFLKLKSTGQLDF